MRPLINLLNSAYFSIVGSLTFHLEEHVAWSSWHRWLVPNSCQSTLYFRNLLMDYRSKCSYCLGIWRDCHDHNQVSNFSNCIHRSQSMTYDLHWLHDVWSRIEVDLVLFCSFSLKDNSYRIIISFMMTRQLVMNAAHFEEHLTVLFAYHLEWFSFGLHRCPRLHQTHWCSFYLQAHDALSPKSFTSYILRNRTDPLVLSVCFLCQKSIYCNFEINDYMSCHNLRSSTEEVRRLISSLIASWFVSMCHLLIVARTIIVISILFDCTALSKVCIAAFVVIHSCLHRYSKNYHHLGRDGP